MFNCHSRYSLEHLRNPGEEVEGGRGREAAGSQGWEVEGGRL